VGGCDLTRRDRVSANKVLASRHRLEVCWVDAAPNATKVIKVEAGRDLANERLERDAMRALD